MHLINPFIIFALYKNIKDMDKIKELEVRPPGFPGTFQGGRIAVIDAPYEKVEEILGEKFDEIHEKYTMSIPVRYKGQFYTVYCQFGKPRIGEVQVLGQQGRFPFYKDFALELAWEIEVTINPKNK